MPGRVIIVPPDATVLQHASTKILHTYANGDVLVQTEAIVDESEAAEETPVSQGVRLEDVSPADLEKAREGLFGDGEPAARLRPIPAYVELIGPVDRQWLKTLREHGVVPLRYQPENAYFCRGTAAAFQEVSHLDFVVAVTPLTDALKGKVAITELGEEPVWIVAQGTGDEIAAVMDELDALPEVDIERTQEVDAVDFYLRLRASVTSAGQGHLLKHHRVLRVERFVPPRPEDEVAGLILAGQYTVSGIPQGSYLHWLEDHGLNGAGVTIGIVDNGVDVSHVALSGRIKDLAGGKKAWHGTFVAGHAAGCYLDEQDGEGFVYGLGTAPAADVLAQDNQRSATALCKETATQTGPSGIPGLVQNNSWGKGLQDPMDYGSEEATYDRLVRNADPSGGTPKPLAICFSSGNSGAAGLTRPKAAKNVIVTGNSENYRDVGGSESDNISELYTGSHESSHGNCGDGRIRPHVMAPGEWTASANYDSLPGQKEYISARLTWGGGSSGASPKTAGACALLIQWWRRHNAGKDPSPAMLRALIVNGAEDTKFDGPIPNNRQGWGRLNLDNILAEDVHHTYLDQTLLLTERGEEKAWQIRVSDPTEPVKVTLAWTDPPGSLGSGTPGISAVVNKLALRVEANGKRYQGNQFVNGWSTDRPLPGQLAEGWDNLQNVYLAPGVARDTIRVSVRALDITTDCLSGMPEPPQQDFALVITNGHPNQGFTPADVFLVIDDEVTGDPTPDDPEDFWDDPSGRGDADDLNADWWDHNNPAAGDQPGSGGAGHGDASDEDAWWEDDFSWSQPEAERRHRNPRLADNSDFVRGVEAGVDILMAHGGHGIVLGSGTSAGEAGDDQTASSLVRIDAETAREQAYAQAISGGVTQLSSALARLIANWESFGTAPTADAPSRRRAAVVVVGSGTRVSPQDLAALRQLAFIGHLYLVSHDSAILSFLAQRLHLSQGVQFRLADSPAELAALVRDTLAEAGGAQQVGVVKAMSQPQEGMVVSRHGFYVVGADVHLTIRIRYQPEVEVQQITLQPPDREAFTVMPDGDREGVQVRRPPQPGVVQLDLKAPDDGLHWAGQWRMEVAQPWRQEYDAEPVKHPEKWANVSVWAVSRLDVALRTRELPGSEASRDENHVLAALHGKPGVSFSRLDVQPRVIDSSQQGTTETERSISVTVQSSRLDGDGTGTEAPRDMQAASISAPLPMPRRSGGALVLDLPVRAFGVAPGGERFARSLRTNVIQLEPRSAWRRRLGQRPIISIYARIVEVRYAGGEIIGLRLRKGDRQRNVAIRDPVLRRQLTRWDRLDDLRAANVHFSVVGRELVAITRVLNGHVPDGGPPPGEGLGIEGPATEPALPESEATGMDYPWASRFVAARYYRRGTAPRTITRIVIHITDGQPRIEGTIAWFQNPVNRDGTPRPVSAHYIVGQSGEVVQMVRDRDVAFHARSANGDSIGIEHNARAPGTFGRSDPGLYPTALQYAGSAALVRWLCEGYGIPMDRDHIQGHSEADPQTTHTGCPNAVWNWDYFMDMVISGMSLPQPV